jgi:hypothetical protein
MIFRHFVRSPRRRGRVLARILETLTTAELEGVKVYVEQKLTRRSDRRQNKEE